MEYLIIKKIYINNNDIVWLNIRKIVKNLVAFQETQTLVWSDLQI